MSDIKGKLEVSVLFAKGKKPPDETSSRFFAMGLGKLGITAERARYKSTWGMIKFTSTGTTGVTDIPTVVRAKILMAASDPNLGTLNILVEHHPDGPAAAALMAGQIAERLFQAFDFSPLEGGFVESSKHAHAIAHTPTAGGLGGVFKEVSALFTPE